MKARGAKVERKCKGCGDTFMARVADVNRGWGNFCSKSCKAVKQEQRTGQYARLLRGGRSEDSAHIGEGWYDHKIDFWGSTEAAAAYDNEDGMFPR